MSNLLEVAELAWRQLKPDVSKEEFIATAKYEFSYQSLLRFYEERKLEGTIDLPPHLLDEKKFDVVNNEVDLSGEKIMYGLPNGIWLQQISDIEKKSGNYTKTTINLVNAIGFDDIGNDKPYYVSGRSIKFPNGTHSNKINVIFAGAGKRIDNEIFVDENIAALVRNRLIEIYGNKTSETDKTENGNSKI